MTPRIPPVILVLICGAIGWVLSHLTPSLNLSDDWRFAPAVFFLGIGVTILVLALAAFARVRTTVNPLTPAETEALVTTGLYRLSRNPMYLAMAAILTGGAFLTGNFAAFAAPVLFIWVMTEFQIKPEELALEAKFGEVFAAYRRHTRRWI